MTDWTAERLEALPEGTVIVTDRQRTYLKDGKWWPVDDECPDPSWIVMEGVTEVRVVSVPVDALLSDEAILAAAKAAEEAQGWPWYGLATHHQQVALATAAVAVRAAIAHITGEES